MGLPEKNSNGHFVAYSNLHADSENNNLYPINLRNFNSQGYSIDTWPFTNIPVLDNNADGPFGNALQVRGRELFANIKRSDFANTALDISGHQPFTLISWVKFPRGSHKHHIVGIWDEGDGRDRYKGQRQYALFRINRYGERLFGHISATGAASYPQSRLGGSQYARIRALNGREISESEWHMIAMTYDGNHVRSYVDGVSTDYSYPLREDGSSSEWIEQDVYKSDFNSQTNPKTFDWGVYHPRNFIIKFNGYNVIDDKVNEHYVRVNLKSATKKIIYGVKAPDLDAISNNTYVIEYAFKRGNVILTSGTFNISNNQGEITLDQSLQVENNDDLEISIKKNGQMIGSKITREIRDGAPFSIGSILGNGAEFDIDGIAMYNRALSFNEIKDLGFTSQNKLGSTCKKLNVELQLDRYPDDNTWNIKDSNGNESFQYGPYNRIDDAEQLRSHDICLKDGTYTFTIDDSYGDGMPNGSIAIKSGSTVIVRNDETFALSKSFNFIIDSTVPAQPTCKVTKVELQLDDYPDESTWSIEDSNSSVIFQYGPYNRRNDAKQLRIHEACLNHGTYSFTITDSYGDGIPNGFIDIKVNNISIMRVDSEFTDTKSFNFTIGNEN